MHVYNKSIVYYGFIIMFASFFISTSVTISIVLQTPLFTAQIRIKSRDPESAV